jgi:hypothetical protein
MGVIHYIRSYLRKLYVTSEDTCLCPHNDYSSLLGGKLTVFKLRNYGIASLNIHCDFWSVDLISLLMTLFYCW